MKVILRLYRQHDLDLLYLHRSKEFSMQKNVKRALRAYINGQSLNIPTPNVTFDKTLPKLSQFHIVLSEEEDKDIIQWLETISKGYRNSLIKNILRHYMSNIMLTPYLQVSGVKIEKIEAKTEEDILKESRRIAKEVLNTPFSESEAKEIEKEKTVKKPESSTETSVVEEAASDNESDFDLFGEFDSMMNSF